MRTPQLLGSDLFMAPGMTEPGSSTATPSSSASVQPLHLETILTSGSFFRLLDQVQAETFKDDNDIPTEKCLVNVGQTSERSKLTSFMPSLLRASHIVSLRHQRSMTGRLHLGSEYAFDRQH